MAEPGFRDARPAVLYTPVLVTLAMLLLRRLRGGETGVPAAVPRTRDAWRFIGALFVATFIAWALLYRSAQIRTNLRVSPLDLCEMRRRP